MSKRGGILQEPSIVTETTILILSNFISSLKLNIENTLSVILYKMDSCHLDYFIVYL